MSRRVVASDVPAGRVAGRRRRRRRGRVRSNRNRRAAAASSASTPSPACTTTSSSSLHVARAVVVVAGVVEIVAPGEVFGVFVGAFRLGRFAKSSAVVDPRSRPRRTRHDAGGRPRPPLMSLGPFSTRLRSRADRPPSPPAPPRFPPVVPGARASVRRRARSFCARWSASRRPSARNTRSSRAARAGCGWRAPTASPRRGSLRGPSRG